MQDIDQRDRDLIGTLQGDIPLISTPYAVIGQMIDMSEKEVIKRTERLKRDGLVRNIAGQFDMRALGYRSCLVAACVKPEKIDDAAATINAHPGVTQNYKRNHDFNLWFTIAVPAGSRLGIDRTIEILGVEAECEVVRPLPTLKLYKNSNADGSEMYLGDGADQPHGDPVPPPSAHEIECIRLLQRDLPLQPRPFDALVRGSGIGADGLIATAKTLISRGQMRRYGAVVLSRKPGFSASALGVWIVPAGNADEYGLKMSQNRAVSHCYLRPVYNDWPYNLYTTVHGRSVDECESIINDLATDNGLSEKRALYPTKEYKKIRLALFAPEADEWESARATRRAASAVS
ncbi:MAG TPA: Lrp/AsnC family transcriptional regulator [Thermoanaerobaculia bacterium]|nr:Lrp/AsnC family transcriptional regulator [Thermoanaerobaculia bacterium]